MVVHMPEEKHLLKVFLCHGHEDKDVVRALYFRLVADDMDAWLDKEKLLPGQDWKRAIRKAVNESHVVVVCLSKQFKRIGYRNEEVNIALEAAALRPEDEIFIIPARLEECETLERLRNLQWVDLFDEGGYEKLMQSLKLCAEHTGLKIPQLNKPLGSLRTEIDTIALTIYKESLRIIGGGMTTEGLYDKRDS